MRGAPTQDESVAASLLHSSGGSKGEEKTSPTLDFSDDDDYDDSDDDISEMQSIPMARRTRRRTAISAAPLNMKEIKTEEDSDNFVRPFVLTAGLKGSWPTP